MKVLIAGANGKIGRRLIPHLVADNIQVRAMVRDLSQKADLETLGAHEVVEADLEGDCRQALEGQDLIDQAKELGVGRFIMVSSMRADDPASGPEKLRHYFAAKGKADDHLRASGLNYTIVRPGRLTEEPPLGKVEVAEKLKNFGDISREDVAKVLSETTRRMFHNKEFDVIAGQTPIRDALDAL